MKLIVNGAAEEIEEQKTVSQFLIEKNIPLCHVAVEINGQMIKQVDHKTTVIHEGDTIELLRFVGGG